MPEHPLLNPAVTGGPRAVELSPEQPVARFFGVPFLKGLAREVTAIHLCPARIHLATLRDGENLEVCDRLTFRSLDLGDLAIARRIAFRPLGEDEASTELAIAGPPGKPYISRLDLQSMRRLPGLLLDAVTALEYSSDGRFVAAGNERGQVRVWHLGSQGPARVLDARTEAPVGSLAFHPEHPTLYATLASGALAEFELAPSHAAKAGPALADLAPGIRFHRIAAGRRGYPIYLAGDDERVYVVDTATGEAAAFHPQVGPITSLQVLPGSGHLCMAGRHAVYLAQAMGPGQAEHLALLCRFEEAIYAVWEIDPGTVLVFHSAEGGRAEARAMN